MNKKRITSFMLICTFSLGLILNGCGKSNPVDYKTAEKNTSQKELTAQVSAEPDNVTKQDDGTKIVTYKNSNYGDYTGTMDYYLVDDKLMMSRWETECDDKEDMNEIYQAICKNVSKDMGEGKADKDQQCTVWSSDEKDVTVGCNVSEDKECIVYMVENQHQMDTEQEKK